MLYTYHLIRDGYSELLEGLSRRKLTKPTNFLSDDELRNLTETTSRLSETINHLLDGLAATGHYIWKANTYEPEETGQEYTAELGTYIQTVSEIILALHEIENDMDFNMIVSKQGSGYRLTKGQGGES